MMAHPSQRRGIFQFSPCTKDNPNMAQLPQHRMTRFPASTRGLMVSPGVTVPTLL